MLKNIVTVFKVEKTIFAWIAEDGIYITKSLGHVYDWTVVWTGKLKEIYLLANDVCGRPTTKKKDLLLLIIEGVSYKIDRRKSTDCEFPEGFVTMRIEY